MKIAFCTAAAVAVLGLSAGTASAQYQTVVPHRGHAHVVPSYSSPYGSGYGHQSYSPGVSFGGFYSSPGVTIGGTYGSGYGGGYYPVQPGYGYGSGYGNYGGHHHHHHHHGHR